MGPRSKRDVKFIFKEFRTFVSEYSSYLAFSQEKSKELIFFFFLVLCFTDSFSLHVCEVLSFEVRRSHFAFVLIILLSSSSPSLLSLLNSNYTEKSKRVSRSPSDKESEFSQWRTEHLNEKHAKQGTNQFITRVLSACFVPGMVIELAKFMNKGRSFKRITVLWTKYLNILGILEVPQHRKSITKLNCYIKDGMIHCG